MQVIRQDWAVKKYPSSVEVYCGCSLHLNETGKKKYIHHKLVQNPQPPYMNQDEFSQPFGESYLTEIDDSLLDQLQGHNGIWSY